MPRLLRPLAVGLCVVIAQLSLAPSAAARQYTLTPIPIGDYNVLGPDAVNNAGQVTGVLFRSGTPAPPPHAFFWSATDGLTDIGPGLTTESIGDSGTVVGHQIGGQSFLWTPADGMRLLSSLPGGAPFGGSQPALARDVNASGQVLAESLDPRNRAFVYNPDGTLRVLPLPAEAGGLPLSDVTVVTLSNRGDAAGWIRFSNGGASTNQAVVWPAEGGFRLLDDLPGGIVFSQADVVNSRGQVSGSGIAEGGQRPVIWQPDGRIVDLGLLPGKKFGGTAGINDAGEVAGWSSDEDSLTSRAFVWTESEGLLDLNNLLDATGGGWTLTGGQDINNSGQILVNGWFEGRYRGALLTPVPEPAALALLAPAGLAALRRRRRGTTTA
jgi:probable HAF family extracellular repeat protein